MLVNLIIDPNSPCFLNVSSSAFDLGEGTAKIYVHLMDDNAIKMDVFRDSISLGKNLYKAHRDAKKTFEIMRLFGDLGLTRFYTKFSGRSEKLILTGYAGLRRTSNFTRINADKGFDRLKIGPNRFKTKVWMVDAAFEIVEWGSDTWHGHAEGNSLSIEQHVKHFAEVAGTAVGATTTMLTAGILLGIAGTGIGIPVVAMIVIPAFAGSLVKSGYNAFVDHQIKQSNNNESTRRFIPDETPVSRGPCSHTSCHAGGNPVMKPVFIPSQEFAPTKAPTNFPDHITKGVNTHVSCHSTGRGPLSPPFMRSPAEVPSYSEDRAIDELLQWISQNASPAAPQKSSSGEFSKKIRLP